VEQPVLSNLIALVMETAPFAQQDMDAPLNVEVNVLKTLIVVETSMDVDHVSMEFAFNLNVEHLVNQVLITLVIQLMDAPSATQPPIPQTLAPKVYLATLLAK